MTAGKMHPNEVHTDASLVRCLIAAQFPQWAHLSITPVDSAGTDNAIYRLGEDLAVRLPRIHWAVNQIDKEFRWLRYLAPSLPLAIPVPLVKGEPGQGYPWHWAIYPWLEGENETIDRIADPLQTAIKLAQFITALQQIDATGGPLAVDHNSRGASLATRDREVRQAIAAMRGTIDTDAATRVWEAALQTPQWNRDPVWFHGDMLPGNLLFKRGRLSAVIDFGGLAVGDPACDLMIAWGLFSGESRKVFRAALEVDDATWERGRGHALAQAVIFIPYYIDSNPVGVGYARRAIDEILADHSESG
jgi:aminoglycoside phosphotransferase (APT) family kinase protein